MSNGNATTTARPVPAVTDLSGVSDCGSLDANDFETIQVGMSCLGVRVRD